MKIMSWNSRGVHYSLFRREVKELLSTHRPEIICFMETKAEFGSSALNFMRRRGYDCQFQVPASGFAGGLWLFWKSSTHLSIIFSTSQSIHCSVLFRGSSFFMVFAYIKPQDQCKDVFWQHMHEWMGERSGACVLMGDLNDIASMDEVSPRTTSIYHRAQRFRNRLDYCGLMDMEALGCKYTWCRRRHGRVILRERLDRILVNSEAQFLLQGAKAFNLPRTCSDHHPILFNLETAASHPPANKPVRFEAAWLSREEFGSIFTNAWAKNPSNLTVAINNTSAACISWGKSVFGNIFRKKRLLKARISGIQNSPRYQASTLLQSLEDNLLEDYQKVLHEEELLWFQKSRVDWIASGDRNTSFYHTSTMVKRNRNKIGALKIGDEWHVDPVVLKSHVKDFFEELFTAKETVPLLEDLSTYQPILSDEAHSSLLQPATLEEVRTALFSMKGLKSPGPDGIPALFYQRHWDTVAETFLDFINQALLNGSFDACLTKAYVALIPKDDSPDIIQKFRPISLLNVAYKVLSKLIVNRLRPHLQSLIGPWQNSFLAGRSTVDNIIVTQEAVHSMKRLKGGRGTMILKVDLHKAFDSIDWGFLRQVLLDFNFPLQLVNLIMFSVTSVQLGILWNGEPLPWFSPHRGLRQGDPLSPYLFILVMEKLAQMIQRRVDSKAWKPLSLSRGGVSISHLFYADDLMLFAQASGAQLDVILECLDQFAKSSGLILNLQKSKLFFSPNVQPAMANALSARCGIPLSSDLGVYLGIPITHGRHSHKNYRYLLERMQQRLAGWKRDHLSLAGRKVLIQSVTSSIPAYTMQSTLLPKSTCDAIDRLNRDFLWGSESGARKPHLVSWEIACTEKKYGGLGLRSASDNNKAFVAKLGWRILTSDSALWCQVMQTKYLRGRSLLESKAIPSSSFIWRGILQCCSVLQLGLRWRIGSGERVNFWKDTWAGNAPLLLDCSDENLPGSLSLTVADIITPEREWDLDSLHGLVPNESIDTIRAIPLSRTAQLPDSIFWTGSMDGSFSVKSAYHLIQGQRHLLNQPSEAWNWIWKLPCAESIRVFVWLLVRGRVLTNSVRFARHIASSSICPRCESFDETPIHLLRDCYYTKVIWGLLGFVSSEFFTLTFFQWLKNFSMAPQRISHSRVSSPELFLSAVWLIWKDRNALVFRNKQVRPQDLCSQIFQHAKYTKLAMNPLLPVRHSQPRWVSWKPPDDGWFKLNTDGSFARESNSASAGGLIRNSLGSWLTGFTVNIGRASVFMAELWGLREGLRLCKALGLTRVFAELDSLMVVHLINNNREPDNLSAAIVLDIKNLTSEFQDCILQHTLREGNAAADYLASLGHNSQPGLSILNTPPVGLRHILAGDQLGASFLRP
ncbi:hypothetical protein SLA2020_238810 [Shorea laevis]